ncbi:GNAT family N-acetyltransferase [Burkholderia vietnamiensis]|nr:MULTISPECIES: GNAT family N-acetyltransferase [Burkholderia]KVF80650.1 GCN5 family acetyltransferase [Burkholderia vietnamiensis]KVF85726.1 GCN5 family acetyltransferase [Burkholderia vietnamiensis]KVF94346.1 GCN5 family acetyltransferase [Burkholderia vietnamiensis]KVF98415.1 GCN5 family acetyltransferase [Burkholderia vietnamiensis]MBR8013574.1 GNAT family N-acetyltransferase [Burkholderia vietnamiensis]
MERPMTSSALPPVTSPPILDTPRLILEGHPLGDFDALAAMWTEPTVVAHIFNGKPSAPRDSWMRLLAYRGLWPLLGYGYWAIREKASGRYVGDLGFADFHRAIEPSIRGVPEAGWALASWAHGKGYATEALTHALHWLDAQQRFERSVCLIAPTNTASIRVAQKAGYADPVRIRFNDADSLLFSRACL